VNVGPSRLLARGVFLAMALLVHAAPAWAGAGGTVDMDVEYSYDDLDTVTWITADGQCENSRFCFRLTRVDHRRPILGPALFGKGAEVLAPSSGSEEAPPESRDLSRINLPGQRPLIIAQTAAPRPRWFVYDLGARRYLIDAASQEAALAVWKGQGLPAPSFEDADQGVKHLTETWRSRFARWALYPICLSPLLGLLLFVWLLVRLFRRRSVSAKL
jgi:hypothetical protein